MTKVGPRRPQVASPIISFPIASWWFLIAPPLLMNSTLLLAVPKTSLHCWSFNSLNWCHNHLLFTYWLRRETHPSAMGMAEPWTLSRNTEQIRLTGALVTDTHNLGAKDLAARHRRVALRTRVNSQDGKMVGWHHRVNGHEVEQTPGDSEGQGSLACCSSCDHKESEVT